jgi:hypothetical protein
MMPEGRGVFPGLMVKEIFALGIWAAGVPSAPGRVYWGHASPAANEGLL